MNRVADQKEENADEGAYMPLPPAGKTEPSVHAIRILFFRNESNGEMTSGFGLKMAVLPAWVKVWPKW
jgi:hypothetical protein